jgi:sensor histidine kinase regulating citrate/malate metabolism
VLNNANRFRIVDTPILIELSLTGRQAAISISNQGAPIEASMLERIFEFGVSSRDDAQSHRGQGLFVARTYMAKMAGTIVAKNIDAGVSFILRLPLAV